MRTRPRVAGTATGEGVTAGAASARRSTMRKVLPLPTSLSTSRAPPNRVRMPWQIESPSPVPRPTGLVVKNGSNSRDMCSAEMPQPVSLIAISTFASSRSRVRTVIVFAVAAPSRIACAALTSTFKIT